MGKIPPNLAVRPTIKKIQAVIYQAHK
ncbi:uncharacterized protein G2W53_009666 [Senna tora]|uniref:Uncharacterized protein n=1 Tax=Senna tora TaxID=362788 RepID=A0A834WZ96_9FABA|nr:uncharacterized protein G2W53_009666 [Senna tora]